MNDEKTMTIELEVCTCHDCVQFGLSSHPVDYDQEERRAYTTKTYGGYSIVKPDYSGQANPNVIFTVREPKLSVVASYPADLLKVG